MHETYKRTAIISVLSIVISLLMTGGVFTAFSLDGMWPAMMMATLCPLLIAPPVSYYYFQQNMKTEMLCVELAQANAALTEASAQLAELARRDGLTRLLNRNAFFADAAGMLAQQNASMLMIDADHFKLINDLHGHAAGDAALVAVAAAIGGCCPQGTLIGRLGGEEFAVLAPALDRAASALLADRIRLAVAAAVLTGERGPFQVTISIGVASGVCGVAVDSLYRAADAQLLRAKRGGRNRAEQMPRLLAA